MSKLSLNARIKLHVAKIGGVTQSTQELGIECLQHAMGESHDVTPLCNLYLGLAKGHHVLFANWALRFGKIQVNSNKAKRATKPFELCVKSKVWDIEGAQAVMWNAEAPKADKALASTFDMQSAVKALLKRASGVCTPEQLADLHKIAMIAHVDASAVVAKSVAVSTTTEVVAA